MLEVYICDVEPYNEMISVDGNLVMYWLLHWKLVKNEWHLVDSKQKNE